MTYERLMTEIIASGCFPELRQNEYGILDVTTVCRIAPDGRHVAPLIRTLLDRNGRWLLTVFGEWYLHVPDPETVPAATVDMLRAMDRCMNPSPKVVKKYNLIEIRSVNFEPADE
jgi:hypothetical protein